MNKHKRREVSEVTDFLIAQFPKTFFKNRNERPLALGIHKTLIERYNALPEKPFSNMLIRTALSAYVRRTSYLREMKAGAMRVDLTGEETSVVTDEMEESAQKTLVDRKAKWKRQKQKEMSAKESQKEQEASMQAAAATDKTKEALHHSEKSIENKRPVISLKKSKIAETAS